METVEGAATKLKSAKGLTADFTMSSQGSSVKGTLTMSGDKFVLSSPDMKIWYDGTTQWSYVPSRKEVDITEPTAEELSQVNPYIIIGSLRSAFTARQLAPSGGNKRVELKSKTSRSDIKTAVLTIDAKRYPVKIELELANGKKAEISITNVKEMQKAPAMSVFRFNKNQAPGAEIVDLR